MSDLLSQDQIDALLSSSDFGDSGGGGDDFSSSGSESKNYDGLKDAFTVFGQSARSTLETLISKDVSLTPSDAAPVSQDSLTSTFAEPILAIRLPYEAGLDGDIFVLLTKKAAATLSDLMMMGDGSAEYSEEHKDAIGEIVNQITGSFNAAIGEQLSLSLSIGAVDVQDFDPANPPMSLDGFDMVVMSLTMDGLDETVVMLVSAKAGEPFMKRSGKAELGESDTSLSMDELEDLSGVAGAGFEDDAGPAMSGHGSSFVSGGASQGNIDMLLDVELDVSIELGRAELPIKRVLELAPGSIVELDRLAGEPVDLLVNNKVVAKGEVVVVDENFGIRIVSLVSPEERIKSLR